MTDNSFTTDDLVNNFIAKFPDRFPREVTVQITRHDYRKVFGDVPAQDLRDAWDSFAADWQYGYVPQPRQFKKYVRTAPTGQVNNAKLYAYGREHGPAIAAEFRHRHEAEIANINDSYYRLEKFLDLLEKAAEQVARTRYLHQHGQYGREPLDLENPGDRIYISKRLGVWGPTGASDFFTFFTGRGEVKKRVAE